MGKNLLGVVFILGVLALCYGWVMNIIAIWNTQALTGTLIARVIGTFIAPLGGVLGYL